MKLPWRRRTEQRSGNVTDQVIAELQRRAAGGSSGDPALCAAVQTAAGIWARSFAYRSARAPGIRNLDRVTAIGRRNASG